MFRILQSTVGMAKDGRSYSLKKGAILEEIPDGLKEGVHYVSLDENRKDLKVAQGVKKDNQTNISNKPHRSKRSSKN